MPGKSASSSLGADLEEDWCYAHYCPIKTVLTSVDKDNYNLIISLPTRFRAFVYITAIQNTSWWKDFVHAWDTTTFSTGKSRFLNVMFAWSIDWTWSWFFDRGKRCGKKIIVIALSFHLCCWPVGCGAVVNWVNDFWQLVAKTFCWA